MGVGKNNVDERNVNEKDVEVRNEVDEVDEISIVSEVD